MFFVAYFESRSSNLIEVILTNVIVLPLSARVSPSVELDSKRCQTCLTLLPALMTSRARMYPPIHMRTHTRTGPINVVISGSVMDVTYDKIGTEGLGIKLRGAYGFEVNSGQGATSTWVKVNATSATHNTVSVAIPPRVVSVSQVRYAFDDAPSVFTNNGPAVFNGEGLPGTPWLWNVTKGEE